MLSHAYAFQAKYSLLCYDMTMKPINSRAADYILLAVFFAISGYYIYFLFADFLFAGDDDLLGISLLMVVGGLPVFILSTFNIVKIVRKMRSTKPIP